MFQPLQVKPIMQPTAHDMDGPIGRLGTGQVSPWLGMRGIHHKESSPRASIQKKFIPVTKQFSHRPCFSLVIRQGRIHSISPVFCSIFPFENHSSFVLWRALRMIRKRDQQNRSFPQSHQHQSLSAINRRKRRCRITPCGSAVLRNTHRHAF